MTREIPLNPSKYGKAALVDDRDYDWLSQYTWELVFKETGTYVIHVDWNGGKRTRTYMHRLITDCPKGLEVDHKNRDPLDNQRHNLRICTGLQNKANQGLGQDNLSGYKGIFWSEFRKRWTAKVKCGQRRASGRFKGLREAVDFYNENAALFFGEFAWLNEYNPSDEKPISALDRRHSKTYTAREEKSSRFRGVDYDIHADAGKNGKRWRAQICVNYKKIGLGRWETEEDAARAYNEAAIRYLGDRAKLNDI